MHVVQVNYVFDPCDADPEALLDRFETLTGWSRALLSAGAERVRVAQRFSREADLVRDGVEYLFRADGGPPDPRLSTLPRRLHRAVRDLSPEVVHVNGLGFPAQVLLLRSSLGPGPAILLQDHASPPPRRRTDRAAARLGLRAADGFLFSAAEQAEPWRAAGLVSPAQGVWVVMESSTSLVPLPRAEARRRTGLEGEPALLWVGRLDANKDPMVVLEGLERAIDRLPGARLTMLFGADELLPDVRARVEASDRLRGRVHLRGRVPHAEMAAFYGAADLFVLASHREGSGYALLEALACGLFPVVTDIPSFRVLTGAAGAGALFPAGDAAAFAEALVRTAPEGSRPAQGEIRARFEERLGWAALGRRALEVYREAIVRRRNAG